MKTYHGTATCRDGHEFEWQFIKLESGDAAFGDMSKMMMNVVNYYDKVAEVRCPECGKTGFVDL